MLAPVLPRRLGAGPPRVPPALRTPAFRRYWLAQVVSMTGAWMQQVAQALVVLTLTGSALAVGAVGVAGSLPLLVLTLHGGALADRHDRRRILLATQAALAALAAAFAGLVAAGAVTYWAVLALAALLGVATALDLPAGQAFVAELVEPEDLPQAVALNAAAFNAARLVGPALAGLAIAAAGFAAAFAANAASFLPVLAVLAAMRGRRPRPREAHPPGGRAMREALAYVRGQPHLAGLIGFAGLTSLLVFPHVTVLLPLYVTGALGAGPGWVGGLLSCVGCGSLLGALAMLKAGRSPRGVRRRLALAAGGVALGLVGLAAAPGPAAAAPAAAVLAFCLSLGMAQVAGRVQQLAPDGLRGRITGIHALAFAGATPVAVLLVSVLAEAAGQRAALLACAAAYAGGSAALWAGFLRAAAPAPVPGRAAAPAGPAAAEAEAAEAGAA